MPKIQLHLDIQIDNYPEILKNRYKIARKLARVPILGSRLESFVDSDRGKAFIDSKVVEEIKSSLGNEVASSLEDQLSKNGVNSKVFFSFQD